MNHGFVFSLFSALMLVSGLISPNEMMARKTSGIYHDGWIDFNKNGVMDIYENPSEDIDRRVRIHDRKIKQGYSVERDC